MPTCLLHSAVMWLLHVLEASYRLAILMLSRITSSKWLWLPLSSSGVYLGHTNVRRKARRSALADEADEEAEEEALTHRALCRSCIISGVTQLGEAHHG
jgi:hypothetical protein